MQGQPDYLVLGNQAAMETAGFLGAGMDLMELEIFAFTFQNESFIHADQNWSTSSFSISDLEISVSSQL